MPRAFCADPKVSIAARIDLGALRQNLAALRGMAPNSRVCAVIKANAYGHGAVRVARALQDVDSFAVARLDEALALRAAGVDRPIVLLEGVFSATELAVALREDFELVLHDPSQLELLAAHRSASDGVVQPLCWIKVDTGMNRLGFRPEQVPAVFERLQSLSVRPRELRLMTHLATADEPENPLTSRQLQRFQALCARLAASGHRPATSIANSAGLLHWPQTRVDWIRPGLALYGVSPSKASAGSFGLRAAMSLHTKVIALREVHVGESVGYGASWRAERPTRLAIIAAGYADGIPRHLPSGAPILFAAGRAPIVGRISMDMIAVDVTDLPPLQVGDEATLWGPGLPVEEVAAHAGTIAYELLCAVAPRVPIHYL